MISSGTTNWKPKGEEMNMVMGDDDMGPAFARWLAPYVVEELRRQGYEINAPADYDSAACMALVREMGVNSLNRAGDFFRKLEADGEADSVTMGVHIGVGTPRNISSALTTPVKRITKRLGYARLPWDEDEAPDGRTVWRDRDGIADRMVKAIDAERHRRFNGPASVAG